MVQSVSVVVPARLLRPPPLGAELLATVQSVSVRVPPLLHRPPPFVEPTVLTLLLTVQLVSETVPPWLYSPAPFVVVEPFVMVRSVKVAVTPPSTWNTRLAPPPLTVTPTAGPVIDTAPVVLLSSS